MKFNIPLSCIDLKYNFAVEDVSSVIKPKNNTIIFVNEKYFQKYGENLKNIHECLIFLHESINNIEFIPNDNAIVKVNNPRLEYAKFLKENIGTRKSFISDLAVVSQLSKIGSHVLIEPFVVIEDNVTIGDNCIIKSGTKILNGTAIGNNCQILENSVIGTVGLAYEYDSLINEYLEIPQLGGLVIEDNVTIGANCVIAKGAIEDTVIGTGSKIDCHCFISHNAKLGHNVMVVGNTLLMGSVTVGNNSYISGGSTVRDNIQVGENVVIGMGSVVTTDIPDFDRVCGVPAKSMIKQLKR